MFDATLPRRRFLGMSIGAAVSFSPLGLLIAKAAAPPPVYHLPYPGGVVWRVGLAVNGGRSHAGRSAYAWDFMMPSGSPITAARAGVVAQLKQSSDQHCRDLSCPDWNNYIVVDHGDASSAAYLHGLKDGARVRIGQRVEQGQLLGLSDQTGQAGGPHLHFQVQYTDPRLYVAQSFLVGFAEVDDSQDAVQGVPQSRHEYRSANIVLYDFDVPNGHFYTQTNGNGGGGGRGFRVVDDSQAAMWTAFKSAGGVAEIGYPVSKRFGLSDSPNHVYQAFQRQIFDWDADAREMQLLNVMDLLHDGGMDGWLQLNREVPLQADFSVSDSGRSWDEVMKAHLALLDGNSAIKRAYLSASDPVEHFGLPMSGIAETDDALMLRTQRFVFQLWKQDTPWAKAGQVTLANSGELVRDAQLFSQQVFEPEQFLPEQLVTGALPLPWEIPGFSFGQPRA